MAHNSQRAISVIFTMISIDDFKVASFEKQCQLITTQTNYITCRTEREDKIYLYHTGKFFVEVVYSPTLKRVVRIHAFNDPSGLLAYVEIVALDDLIV